MFSIAHSDSKLSSSIKGDTRTGDCCVEADTNTTADVREVPEDFGIPNSSLKVFKFTDLEIATGNFSPDSLLGRGKFRQMFLGWVDVKSFAPSICGDGIYVLVKRRSSLSSRRYDQCMAELSLLGQLSHPNIVSLLGYCNHGDENLLVYEYMENRRLDILLFTNAADRSNTLSWEERLKILIGVARALTYLHSSKDQVVCRGVQSSDILIDKDFNAKLIDFGLAKSRFEFWQTIDSESITRPGFVNPDYIRTGCYNLKSDIYGFGVVLLETLTALPAIGSNRPDEHFSLVDWASQILATRKNLTEIMDPRLEQNYPLEAAFKCGALALRCVAYRPKDRPSSEEVLRSLEKIYAVTQ